MDIEVEDFIDRLSKQLNGQIRGAINTKAREENLTLIQLTLSQVWTESSTYTQSLIDDVVVLAKLKKEINDDD